MVGVPVTYLRLHTGREGGRETEGAMEGGSSPDVTSYTEDKVGQPWD